jgi:hypothetical protein
MPQLKAISAALGLVPRWVWYLLGGALALLAVVVWHGGQVKAHDRRVIAARDAYWSHQLEGVRKHALQVRADAETLHAKIATNIRSKTDAELSRIDRHAADLLQRGPGKASCGRLNYPSLPAGAGEHGTPAQPSGSAVGGVPDSGGVGFIALPFDSTVAVARQSDADRAEVIAWRNWYAQESAAWAKLRKP